MAGRCSYWLRLLALVFAALPAPIEGGTTGALSGTVLSQDGAPLPGAHVTVAGAPATLTTLSDDRGHFAFVSLAPYVYTVTVSARGREPSSLTGVNVVADNTQFVTIVLHAALKTLATVVTKSPGLVQPGTTADVYTINATEQAKTAVLGGGGGLYSAYSSLATVPGVIVYPGFHGWGSFTNVSIQGGGDNGSALYSNGATSGNEGQIGYEFDGIPMLRSYDNYPASTLSSLGQQELQVYNGGAPATSESQGLSGFINQVVKTGSFPESITAEIGVATPAQSNYFSVEASGATSDRNFSYYIGASVNAQEPRSIDQFNGVGETRWGLLFNLATPPGNDCTQPVAINYASCYASGIGPGGYIFGPPNMASDAILHNSNTLINLHFGVPHHHDSGKDDIQILYDVQQQYEWFFSSASDWGTSLVQGLWGTSAFPYLTQFIYTGQIGASLPSNYQSFISPYTFPSQPAGVPGAFIPVDQRDTASNGLAALKLQYQHNIGTSAYLRAYAYSYYSDWFYNGPNGSATILGLTNTDYELNNHTYGVTATYAEQLNDRQLLTLEAGAVTSYNLRINNVTPFAPADQFAFMVDSTNPANGICYSAAASPVACANPNTSAGGANPAAVTASLADAAAGNVPALAAKCGGGPCELYVVRSGLNGPYNLGHGYFSSAAINDQYKASDKLLLVLGLRYDGYAFKESDTSGPGYDFFFSAWNQEACVLPGLGQTPVIKPGDVSKPCTDATNFGSGSSYVPATLTNLPNYVSKYEEWQPRIAGTYTFDPATVLRFSYGKYTQPPNAAFQQYSRLDKDVASFNALNWWQFGMYTTSHNTPPQVSYNANISLEHRLNGTPWSFKLTPFYRSTNNEGVYFVLANNQKSGILSALDVGSSVSYGTELEVRAGDFSANGWSGLLTYTFAGGYTYDTPLPGGGAATAQINAAVTAYNAYTSFCAGHSSDARCGLTSDGAIAAPCVDPVSGAFDGSCAAGDIANPYWNAPVQSLVDARHYVVAPVSSAITLIVNYKHDRWAISPSLQFFPNGAYGYPLQTPGVDPLSCTGSLASAVKGDSRYPYGAPGGLPYDAMTCAKTLVAIPDSYTGRFDDESEFQQPNLVVVNAQIEYQASPNVSYVFNAANLVNRCLGGSREPWTAYADSRVCFYGGNAYGILPPTGNIYNPGATFQPQVQFPYQQYFGTQPLNLYLNVKIKL